MLSKIIRRLKLIFIRCIQAIRIGFYRSISTNSVIGNVARYQPVHAVGLGKISVAGKVSIGVFPSPCFLSSYAYIEARNVAAEISIGTGTWINNNFCAIADHTNIIIGENCLIGANVEMLDSDFHGLLISDRRSSKAEWCRSVSIGNNVFIGNNVKILKGVEIGEGSVIANGSVVVKSIPPNSIAGGNPAKVIRAIE